MFPALKLQWQTSCRFQLGPKYKQAFEVAKKKQVKGTRTVVDQTTSNSHDPQGFNMNKSHGLTQRNGHNTANNKSHPVRGERLVCQQPMHAIPSLNKIEFSEQTAQKECYSKMAALEIMICQQ
ncbi:unnamed protein product [Cuscuta campestris]|uniref:Uncharacterized protein n=1 Tax=Cuscuta campestris TaxID=132261 RepID=A0A484LAH5_9ASTE|nr:unnamed protein product [Cuscuta campestris]